MKNLIEILKLNNWKESDITQIYYGKSHACRCGCCGTYHERGSRGFTKALNALKRGVLALPTSKDDVGSNYININLEYTNDRCYCLYND